MRASRRVGAEGERERRGGGGGAARTQRGSFEPNVDAGALGGIDQQIEIAAPVLHQARKHGPGHVDVGAYAGRSRQLARQLRKRHVGMDAYRRSVAQRVQRIGGQHADGSDERAAGFKFDRSDGARKDLLLLRTDAHVQRLPSCKRLHRATVGVAEFELAGCRGVHALRYFEPHELRHQRLVDRRAAGADDDGRERFDDDHAGVPAAGGMRSVVPGGMRAGSSIALYCAIWRHNDGSP